MRSGHLGLGFWFLGLQKKETTQVWLGGKIFGEEFSFASQEFCLELSGAECMVQNTFLWFESGLKLVLELFCWYQYGSV